MKGLRTGFQLQPTKPISFAKTTKSLRWKINYTQKSLKNLWKRNLMPVKKGMNRERSEL
jgi:hypothetical protein